jgi:protein gp37
LEVKKPARIGVAFMGDLFDSGFDVVHRELFRVMAKASWHTFLVLTKQSRNMRVFFEDCVKLPGNVWLGVSVNTRLDLLRIEDLKATDARVKFVSFEPLYEDLGDVDLQGIDWIVIGAQTRPDLQPRPEWVDRLALTANDAGVPVFVKNNLAELLGYPGKNPKGFPLREEV